MKRSDLIELIHQYKKIKVVMPEVLVDTKQNSIELLDRYIKHNNINVRTLVNDDTIYLDLLDFDVDIILEGKKWIDIKLNLS